MELQKQIQYLQALHASELFERLKEARPEDLAAFQEWCGRSSIHVSEFLEIAWADHVLDELDPHREIDVDALLSKVNPAATPWPSERVSHEARDRQTVSRTRRLWLSGIAAVSALCALGLGLHVRGGFAEDAFATQIGEQRTVELGDSSRVTLNTDSAIRVDFSRKTRRVELRHGEAVFKVARDAARPFRVLTRNGIVQAIGTEFNVYDRPDGTDVVVLEGHVLLMARAADSSQIESPSQHLVAGEEARIAFDGSIHKAEHADLARVLAWSKRRLKFDNVPLEEMVREFSRYHRDVRLRIDGVAEGSHHYSGIFDADDPTALERFLSRETDLRLERVGSEVVIRPQVPTGNAAVDQ
jgi:transmembrane sensor